MADHPVAEAGDRPGRVQPGNGPPGAVEDLAGEAGPEAAKCLVVTTGGGDRVEGVRGVVSGAGAHPAQVVGAHQVTGGGAQTSPRPPLPAKGP